MDVALFLCSMFLCCLFGHNWVTSCHVCFPVVLWCFMMFCTVLWCFYSEHMAFFQSPAPQLSTRKMAAPRFRSGLEVESVDRFQGQEKEVGSRPSAKETAVKLSMYFGELCLSKINYILNSFIDISNDWFRQKISEMQEMFMMFQYVWCK